MEVKELEKLKLENERLREENEKLKIVDMEWFEGSSQRKMLREKSCNNCKYHERSETRNKHGKLIAFSDECTMMRVCIGCEYWEEDSE